MYYGDEIKMKNLPREDGILDTRVFVRGPFDWDEAEKAQKDPLSLFTHVAELLHTPDS